jgi:hypothetical protein
LLGKNNELKCDCCGKPAIEVAGSTMGAVSFAYCKECIKNGIEPYWAIISYIFCGCKTFDDMNDTYKEIVRKNLDFYGKTIEEFNQDLKKENEMMMEAYNHGI